jgi:hypothetical protein
MRSRQRQTGEAASKEHINQIFIASLEKLFRTCSEVHSGPRAKNN